MRAVGFKRKIQTINFARAPVAQAIQETSTMIVRYLPLGALLLALATGCNTAPKEPAAESAHEEHGHEHGDHDHADHEHGEHDHGEHDHAEIKDFHQAAEIIESSRDAIRDHLAAGEKEKADAVLHELGHTLEHVNELTSDFADDVRSEIKKDVDELFELYGTLDEQIHGDKEVTYDAVSEKIDAAVERLHERAHEQPVKEAAPE